MNEDLASRLHKPHLQGVTGALTGWWIHVRQDGAWVSLIGRVGSRWKPWARDLWAASQGNSTSAIKSHRKAWIRTTVQATRFRFVWVLQTKQGKEWTQSSVSTVAPCASDSSPTHHLCREDLVEIGKYSFSPLTPPKQEWMSEQEDSKQIIGGRLECPWLNFIY